MQTLASNLFRRSLIGRLIPELPPEVKNPMRSFPIDFRPPLSGLPVSRTFPAPRAPEAPSEASPRQRHKGDMYHSSSNSNQIQWHVIRLDTHINLLLPCQLHQHQSRQTDQPIVHQAVLAV